MIWGYSIKIFEFAFLHLVNYLRHDTKCKEVFLVKDIRSFKNNFGKNIKKLREAQGLSLQQLADITGISISYLNRLEQGKRKSPPIHLVMKLADILNVTIDSLLFGTDRKNDKELADIMNEIGLSNKEANNIRRYY